MIGFLPMNTVSRCSVDMRVKYYEDNLNQDRMTEEAILESLKNKELRLNLLPTLSQTNSSEVIQKIIRLFDDENIEIRGEVFSALFLNKNDILEELLCGLKHNSKNVRSYTMLVLANRNEKKSVHEILRLTDDSSGLVRTCAYGALGHLEIKEAAKQLHNGIFDPDFEAAKSAAYALSKIGEKISQKEIEKLKSFDDPDFKKILKFFD
jgi:HEAT repeat protein